MRPLSQNHIKEAPSLFLSLSHRFNATLSSQVPPTRTSSTLSPAAPITAHIKFVHKNFIYALETQLIPVQVTAGPVALFRCV